MLKKVINFFKKIIKGLGEHAVSEKSASLAYYALYALGPILLLFLFVGRLFVEEEAARTQILDYFENRLGPETAPFFESLIDSMLAAEAGWFFSIVTAVVFVFGLYLFFNFLRRSFFQIFGVDLRHSKDFGSKFANLTYYALYIFILFVLLFTTLAINIGSPIIYNIALVFFPGFMPDGLLNILTTLSIFLVTIFLFGLIYRILSLYTISFKHALFGGVWASVTILILNILLSVYLAISATHSFYGLAGSLVVFLIWVHYAGMALFLGAETAKTHSRKKLP